VSTEAAASNPRDGVEADPPGWRLVQALVAATVVLVVVAVLSALFHFKDDAKPAPHVSVFAIANIVVSLALFLAGCIAFIIGFLRAIGRSRTSQIEFGALFFATGTTAPARVKRALIGCYVVQLVVAVGTALARPLTDQAFVILAPMCAQGAIALWCGTYGTFADRVDDRDTRRRSETSTEDERADATPQRPSASARPDPGARIGARGGPRPRRRR
jgi:hypothetical protein